jgi:hypothetical protein
MILHVEIKKWPQDSTPLGKIQGGYGGPKAGDILLDENGVTWTMIKDYGQAKASAHGMRDTVEGGYHYNSRLQRHFITIWEEEAIFEYTAWVKGFFREKVA